MSRTPDFRELVGQDLPADERERLRRVHDLLLAAGAPPELSPELEQTPSVGGAVSFLPRRRRGAAVLLAAAVAAAVFGGGFLAGAVTHGGGKTTQAAIVVPMHGTPAAPNALASIRILDKDAAGNWPMLMTVQGLKQLPRGGYYELYLTLHGRIAATCGTFNVNGGKTTVSLNAPYSLKRFDGWVVTRHLPGRPEEAKRPVLTT